MPHHYASDFIQDEVINVISASAVVLGALKNVSAFAVLLRMLSVTQSSEINEDQYCAAVLGLGLLGDVRAIEPLLVQLDSLTDAEKDSRATLSEKRWRVVWKNIGFLILSTFEVRFSNRARLSH